jgi:hypothetical protein
VIATAPPRAGAGGPGHWASIRLTKARIILVATPGAPEEGRGGGYPDCGDQRPGVGPFALLRFVAAICFSLRGAPALFPAGFRWRPIRPGLDTSEYIERRMGHKSEFARSKTTHGHEETAEGESEQAVSLMTVQDITELSESEIIGVHRNLKPFRAKRMDWREYPFLVQRTQLRPPDLPVLPPISDSLPDISSPAYVDLDEGY